MWYAHGMQVPKIIPNSHDSESVLSTIRFRQTVQRLSIDCFEEILVTDNFTVFRTGYLNAYLHFGKSHFGNSFRKFTSDYKSAFFINYDRKVIIF